jgi:hypothetical protein
MNTRSARFIPCLALALCLSLPGMAWAQSTTGNLEGRAGSGDSVTVRNVATDHHLEHPVASNGRYRFVRLPIGIYEVVIHHSDGSAAAPMMARARLGETVQVLR